MDREATAIFWNARARNPFLVREFGPKVSHKLTQMKRGYERGDLLDWLTLSSVSDLR
jgi:hypothetical protein